ncbi:MAG TPA: hypothetical protein VJZ71_10715 [Phycisphaerae bacterium]|nr:hypothetical protein [Phycisphaerae bacterium]
MSLPPRNPCRALWPVVGACAAALFLTAGFVVGDDSARLKGRSGRRAVQLWPLNEVSKNRPEPGPPIEMGDWTYRAGRAATAREGVPWELFVTPSEKNAGNWRAGELAERRAAMPTMARERRRPDEATKNPDSIPLIEMPDAVWKKWMAADLQDVVGIHFHELVSDDTARILYTLHKVPADGPDGKPLPGESSVPGTRIEATLLAPVTFSLDQSIVVREDPLKKELAAARGEHEAGHADLSQLVFLAVLAGPQDWNPRYCTGRRARVEYFWKREQIGRSWKGYRNGVGKLLTLRTTVALVPPTRWSMLVPIPPERVTSKHLQEFNESIVKIGGTFAATDRAAQKKFHSEHGEYERVAGP